MENSQKLMTLDMFTPLLNEIFKIDVAEGEPLDLKLVQARAKQLHPSDFRYGEQPSEASVRSDPFGLVFATSLDYFLAQGIYSIHHDAIGRNSIFIVPIGRDADGFRYEAVFN
ncbi:MAG: hypothetical protein JWQ98_2824 [Chlorobi bacterium]|nr:hypothetical protein [Chlorobiota bacterium]